jgi:hypothetical protein
MGKFLHKLGEELEKTADAIEPMAGDPQGLDVSRVGEEEGVPGDHSPVATDEGFEGDQ